ncbi:hypothetical protein EH183_37590 [Streptomyces sp. CB01881]|nr:hypothetical protein C2142_37580 [Streptomyces sp. CB01881]TYC68614.1 hypothetical protein EH183_37590 [Streptomyces sp. CB01881]
MAAAGRHSRPAAARPPLSRTGWWRGGCAPPRVRTPLTARSRWAARDGAAGPVPAPAPAGPSGPGSWPRRGRP